MRGYETNEYEDWDEYEEDGDEQEEEEGDDGYEEAHQPTQEELDYLAMRQRLKESIRKQMKKDTGSSSSGSRDKTNGLRKDNYGSFFGPSQPVIAPRVLQESKSLLENPDLAARIIKTSHKEKKSSVSAPVGSKPRPKHPSTVTNGLRKKVEMLKNTRDYSFLLSEDAEVPASSKGPPPRNVSAPKSDARSAELTQRSRPMVNGRGREDSNFRDGRKPMPPSIQNKPKVGLDKLAHTGKSTDSRKQFGSNNGSGPGRPLAPKSLPVKSSVPATGKVTQPVAKNINSGARKPTAPVQPMARKPTPSNLHSGSNRPTSSHGQSSVVRRPVQKDYQKTSKPKVISKHALPSSKVQRSPPRHPPRPPLRDERPKAKPKRPLRDEGSDDDNAINLIRQMFRYNPNNFHDDDDDADNMEANFDDIVAEEKRSSRIARREDEEQLRLIEEEERRERMRQAKKRKMGR